MSIELISTGDFKNALNFLHSMLNGQLFSELDHYGQVGVDALASATPTDTGLTAESWGYRVIKDVYGPGIEWFNTNHENGVPVAILIQYGHGTGTGGYVQGLDYINPAIQPIFDKIVDDIWKKVTI